MTPSLNEPPALDPTPIFELFRANFATELLAASVAHFDLFGRLAAAPMSVSELRQTLALAERPAIVLLCALRAMGLLAVDPSSRLCLAPLAQNFLVPGGPFYVGDYVAMIADSPGVLQTVERLRTNRPAGSQPDEGGVAFLYRQGLASAMEQTDSARRLTMALAGRAKCVAPLLARLPLFRRARRLLDVGGGTGIYSIACLVQNPAATAIVWDRPEVLKVAAEMAADEGVADRLECRPGDMFADPVPTGCDVILLSNILHDWDVADNKRLVERSAAALAPGGSLAIHDVFLDDDLGGPLPVALYSAALFSVTEGRAYSAAEYRSWLAAAGLRAGVTEATSVHCGVLPATRALAAS